MGKRGPKPTPTKILQNRGSWRGKKNPNEPRPELATVETPPPSWLNPQAKEHWQEISEFLCVRGLLTVADRPALALLCSQKAGWELSVEGFGYCRA